MDETSGLPWKGARRLPYFFSVGADNIEHRAIVCPQCILHMLDVTAPERIREHYHTNRSVMCGRCGILIGPINEEEHIEYE